MEKEKRKVLALDVPKLVHKELKDIAGNRGMNSYIVKKVQKNLKTDFHESIADILESNSDSDTTPYRLFLTSEEHKELKKMAAINEFNMRDFAVASIIKSLK